MSNIVIVGRAILAAGIIAAPLSVLSAETASAQPAPADVCIDGPYPSPPPPWGPGTINGCVNPDAWFNNWTWPYPPRDWRSDAGPHSGWKYVGPGCQYSSNPNWKYEGSDCQRQNP